MSKIRDTINAKLIALYATMQSFFTEERGDTNFISIAIILVVVLVIAGIFITFGNTITSGLNTAIEDFLKIFNK